LQFCPGGPLFPVTFFGRGAGIDFSEKHLVKARVANDFKVYKDKQPDGEATFFQGICSEFSTGHKELNEPESDDDDDN